MRLKPFTPRKLRRRVFSQLWMLALQFILGMVLNLLGDEKTGAKHALYIVVLVVHILNALGLVEGGIYIAMKERSKSSWRAALTLFVPFCGGVLYMLTKQDIWSFVMACGFLLSSWLYVAMYADANSKCRQEPSSE